MAKRATMGRSVGSPQHSSLEADASPAAADIAQARESSRQRRDERARDASSHDGHKLAAMRSTATKLIEEDDRLIAMAQRGAPGCLAECLGVANGDAMHVLVARLEQEVGSAASLTSRLKHLWAKTRCTARLHLWTHRWRTAAAQTRHLTVADGRCVRKQQTGMLRMMLDEWWQIWKDAKRLKLLVTCIAFLLHTIPTLTRTPTKMPANFQNISFQRARSFHLESHFVWFPPICLYLSYYQGRAAWEGC